MSLLYKKNQKGYALLISVVVIGILMTASLAMTTMATRQLTLSNDSRESLYAFYAADAGAECALYWDIQKFPAFSHIGTGNIHCSGSSIVVDRVFDDVGENLELTDGLASFSITSPYCADVEIEKINDGGVIRTEIRSRGYNTCDTNNPRRVERAVEIRY